MNMVFEFVNGEGSIVYIYYDCYGYYSLIR